MLQLATFGLPLIDLLVIDYKMRHAGIASNKLLRADRQSHTGQAAKALSKPDSKKAGSQALSPQKRNGLINTKKPGSPVTKRALVQMAKSAQSSRNGKSPVVVITATGPSSAGAVQSVDARNESRDNFAVSSTPCLLCTQQSVADWRESKR